MDPAAEMAGDSVPARRGERGEDGMDQTDVGIGTAIRSNRSTIPAIVVMPQCRKDIWWIQPPMDELAMASLNAAIKEFKDRFVQEHKTK